jgi:glycosyltransferase involved in cell wall biosynthesis
MSKAKRKILLISHDATRTGAPILLLNLAKALKDDYEVSFLLKNGGAIQGDFEQQGHTVLVKRKLQRYRKIKGFNKIASYFKLADDYDLSGINWESYDIIISNTITNGDILQQIRKTFNGPIFSYVHELEMATRLFTTTAQLQNLIKYSSAFLVPAQAVKQFLITKLGVDESKIALLHYYIPSATGVNQQESKSTDEFIVGGVGTSDWRKSPDLFVTIAKLLFAKQPDAKIKFNWKGASTGNLEMQRLQYDLKKSGLEDKVSFIPSSSSVNDFYKTIDLFLLTSREDPYPLVVLEAASYHHPTICFANTGGAPEFVQAAGAGHISPYLDLNNAVDKILFYYNNQEQLKLEGTQVKKELDETHNSTGYIKAHFEAAIKKLS